MPAASRRTRCFEELRPTLVSRPAGRPYAPHVGRDVPYVAGRDAIGRDGTMASRCITASSRRRPSATATCRLSPRRAAWPRSCTSSSPCACSPRCSPTSVTATRCCRHRARARARAPQLRPCYVRPAL
eukprot:3285512-Prymnesium_polylepis.1